jgi:hypothetical protein
MDEAMDIVRVLMHQEIYNYKKERVQTIFLI